MYSALQTVKFSACYHQHSLKTKGKIKSYIFTDFPKTVFQTVHFPAVHSSQKCTFPLPSPASLSLSVPGLFGHLHCPQDCSHPPSSSFSLWPFEYLPSLLCRGLFRLGLWLWRNRTSRQPCSSHGPSVTVALASLTFFLTLLLGTVAVVGSCRCQMLGSSCTRLCLGQGTVRTSFSSSQFLKTFSYDIYITEEKAARKQNGNSVLWSTPLKRALDSCVMGGKVGLGEQLPVSVISECQLQTKS